MTLIWVRVPVKLLLLIGDMMPLVSRLRKGILREWTPNPAILLHPNVPKPLHGVAPRVVLGQAWWDRERRECYKTTNFHCIACGVHKSEAKYHKWLEAHEQYEINYQKGIAKYLGPAPLCHFCHNFIHDGRLQALLDQGKLHHDKFVKIIQHGEKVLAKAGLARPTHAEREAKIEKLLVNGKLAAWGDWRLLIGRKKYPPKFPTMEAWIKHYDQKDEDA